ncbi:ubiquitin-conjugating enzyme E2 8 [Eutrema salsugineum]|uniref:ubiquitin-conjugating enzyme E2 8 n=1 Tax=Eutrema salsugineum TaxID=72664 RepID=UPI000CED0666|nr:ubiquitin-conjugating enzyme E2 8 [Eutrema salsugineum]
MRPTSPSQASIVDDVAQGVGLPAILTAETTKLIHRDVATSKRMQSNSVLYWEKSLMIQKKEVERVKSPLYSTGPVDGDISYWKALLFGPAGSPYENRVFLIDMHFPPLYPFKPPKVFFSTKVFHPNVGDRGDIFLRMLSTDYYSPSSTIHKVLTKIHEMLSNPALGEG